MTPKTLARALVLITQALERSSGPETLEDVKAALEASEAHLWLTDKTAVVTEVIGTDLNVWLYAGSLQDVPGLFASAKAWGRNIGLKRMTVDRARKGWARALRPLGFIEGSDCDLECSLEA